MTPATLDDALNAMQATAAGDVDRQPGLITLQTDDYLQLDVKFAIANLADGLRYRDIQVSIASTNETAVLTRAQAGQRGAPYRDLISRP